MTLTKDRWVLTIEPVIVDGRKTWYRGILEDKVVSQMRSWAGGDRDSIIETARDHAEGVELNEAHKQTPIEIIELA